MSKKLLTVDAPGAEEVPGETKPRRNVYHPESLIKGPPDGNTLHECLLHGVSLAADKPFLGRRPIVDGTPGPYVWETYAEVFERVKNIGAYFVQIGVKEHEQVGLFSINRPEWVIAEHGCFSYSLSTVPLYDTLGAEAVEYIISETNLKVVVTTSDKIKFILDLVGAGSSKVKTLTTLVIMDGPAEDFVARAKELGINIISFEAAEKAGKDTPVALSPPKPDDLATICYTSGTTGLPKGVKLTHTNMVSFAGSILVLVSKGRMYNFTPADSYISYLPLAHVMEREVMIVVMYCGASIGFYQGDTLKLLDDVAVLKPTIFASVPRLYNRIYDRVLASVKAKGGVAKYLFETAFAAKKANLKNGTTSHFLWDRLVFGAVRARLGGRVKIMLTGSAPISNDVLDFMRICFCCEFFEGYGQTETAAALTVSDRYDYVGRGGLVLPCAEVKLVDVPSMSYTSKDKPFPRGEIMVRGNNVFIGYHNSPDKTAETIDADGWAHTGDIGLFDEQGRVQIIDRLKNIFKLSQGEYIAPEKIENVLAKHELVAQAFVYGDSLQSTIVAVIVPDEEQFMKWAKAEFGDKTYAELTADKEVRKAMLKQIEKFCREDGLKGFEIVKAIHLDPVPFSMENGLHTPSFKLKRHEAKLYYQKAIDEMYASLA